MSEKDTDYLPRTKKLANLRSRSATQLDLKEEKYAIEGLGKHFQLTKSSSMGTDSAERELMDAEEKVNNWYRRSVENNAKPIIQQTIEEASNILGSVVTTIKTQPGKPRSPKHFAKIREVGKKLVKSADLIDDENE